MPIGRPEVRIACAVFLIPVTALAAQQPGGSTSFPGWNVSYQLPAQWQLAQSQGRLQTLASAAGAGTILIAPGAYATFDEITADLSAYLQSIGAQAYPVEQPASAAVAGFQAQAATYASQDQVGRVLHGRHLALLTQHGTGISVFAVGTPEQMPALKGTVERIAATIRAAPPQVNAQAMAALAGTWILYAGKYDGGSRVGGTTSRSHEETVFFDGRGGFQYQSSSSVMVTTPGYTGDAGGASSTSDAGSYTVIGNTLVFTGQRGKLAVDFQLQGGQLTAAGKTYLRQ